MNGKHKSKVEITAAAVLCAQKGERNRSKGFLAAQSILDKYDYPTAPAHEMKNEGLRKAFAERAAVE